MLGCQGRRTARNGHPSSSFIITCTSVQLAALAWIHTINANYWVWQCGLSQILILGQARPNRMDCLNHLNERHRIDPVWPAETRTRIRAGLLLLIMRRHSAESFDICFYKDTLLWAGIQTFCNYNKCSKICHMMKYVVADGCVCVFSLNKLSFYQKSLFFCQ